MMWSVYDKDLFHFYIYHMLAIKDLYCLQQQQQQQQQDNLFVSRKNRMYNMSEFS